MREGEREGREGGRGREREEEREGQGGREGRRGKERGEREGEGGRREEEEEWGKREEGRKRKEGGTRRKMRDREAEAGVTKATTRGHHISSPFQSWHSLPSNPGTFPTSQAPVEILTTAHYDCVVYVMPSACHSLSTGSPRVWAVLVDS